MSFRLSTYAAVAALLLCSTGCPGDDDPTVEWQKVHSGLSGALLSVWGTSASDVWAVGGDTRDGSGPLVLHYDGDVWTRHETGQSTGDLWWVYGFEGGPVFMGGSGGVILRYAGGQFTPMTTPGTNTVFGIWGTSPTDMWAVGGSSAAMDGFVWRLQNDEWVAEPTAPADLATRGAVWKVFGRSSDDVWFVGSNGVSLYWDGTELSEGNTGVQSSLFTVHAYGDTYAAVGGLASGIIIEKQGDGSWVDVTPDPPPFSLSGISLGPDGTGYAVGLYGAVFARDHTGWHEEVLGFAIQGNFHAVWIDPTGGVWAVGGQTSVAPLTDGVLTYLGDTIPSGDIQ